MKFTDFTNPKELIGKKVLRTIGQSYSDKETGKIETITRVTKTAFGITGTDNLYNISDGIRKFREKWSTHTDKCTLISEQEAIDLINMWRLKREHKERIAYITEALPKLNMDESQKIHDLIKNTFNLTGRK